MSNRFLVFAALAASLIITSCGEDPASPDSLPRGAFSGVNTRLLSTLITYTTNIGGDTATGIVVSGDIGASRVSGEPAPARSFRGRALFDVDGTAAGVGAVTANGIDVPFLPSSPPAHYELDTTATAMFANGRSVEWRAPWKSGETIAGRAVLPPQFGRIELSVGSEVSVAALDGGQTVTVTWSEVVPDTRVFMYVSWRPEVFAPTLVSPPKPIYVEAPHSGRITLPGFDLSRLIQRTNGRLTFVLYRGVYENIAQFDNGSKSLASFAYVADSVHVNLVP